MLTEETKIMRYAGNMVCAFDYALSGDMERAIEKMSKENCLESIRKLYTITTGGVAIYDEAASVRAKWAKNISDYKQQTAGYSNDDIAAVENWNVEEVYKAYYKEKAVIETSLILNNLCKATGESVGMIAYKVGIKKWTLLHWTSLQEEISPKFQEAIKTLESEGRPYTIYDVFAWVTDKYGDKNKIKPQEGAQP